MHLRTTSCPAAICWCTFVLRSSTQPFTQPVQFEQIFIKRFHRTLLRLLCVCYILGHCSASWQTMLGLWAVLPCCGTILQNESLWPSKQREREMWPEPSKRAKESPVERFKCNKKEYNFVHKKQQGRCCRPEDNNRVPGRREDRPESFELKLG